MSLPKYLSFCILILFITLVKASAQDAEKIRDIQFDHLTIKEGLPTNYGIWGIVQDKQGFLWFGSINGLQRYDGHQFETFRHNPLDSASISHNWITDLVIDHSGMLWVGTRYGLNRYDPARAGSMFSQTWLNDADLDITKPQDIHQKNSFTRYRHDPEDLATLSSDTINVILETHDSVLWIGTNRGLSRLDQNTNTFTNYYHDPDDPHSILGKKVNTLFEDRAGRLWIGTSDPGGLNLLESSGTSEFNRVITSAYEPSIGSGVTAIGEDRQGNLYFGTCHGILHRYDRVSGRLVDLLPDPDDPNRLHAPTVEKAANASCRPVEIIYEDQGGKLWVGTNGVGLNRYDPAKHQLVRFQHDPNDESSLSSDDVKSFYQDRQGIIWIGTHSRGINKSIPSAERFRIFGKKEISANRGIRALYEDDSGLIWVGTEGSQLFQFDPLTQVLSQFSSTEPQENGLWGASIWSVFKDREGIIWVGQQPGLYRIDPVKKSNRLFVHDPANPFSLSWNSINHIMEDEEGTLWISTHNGLNRYDRENDRFTRFMNEMAVTKLYQDRRGDLWWGTFSHGIKRFDKETESFTTYLDGTGFQTMYEDTEGRFWVVTSGDGLFLLDRDSGQARQFTTKDGMPSNGGTGIMEDELGFIWLDSYLGLTRLDPSSMTFITYDEDDGISHHAAINGRVLRSQSGKFYLGGNEGLIEIDPKEFVINPIPPEVVITGFQVFDDARPMLQDPGRILSLSYDENELTFHYTGLHFANPARNQYAYYLEGYESDWREVGQTRAATYTNLEPGSYTFWVKAANSDGVWNDEAVSIDVLIQPPWWLTPWAYMSYGITVIGILFIVDRIQRRRLIAREREKTRESELAQAREIEKAHTELQQTHEHLKTTQAQLIQKEKLASLGQLTAGIAHEIKNPLNFINNFAEINGELAQELREVLNPDDGVNEIITDLEKNAEVIAQHGKRADAIVTDMMKHASSGDSQFEKTEINQLVSEYIDLAYHGKRAQTSDFQVQIKRELSEHVGIVEVVPSEIGRVILNLLTNAFDSVTEQATKVNGDYLPIVKVTTNQVGNQIEILVSDNGTGIPEAIRKKIFLPFFTTKPTGSGTGLGLSLSHDIITQGHNGSLTLQSNEHEGAIFIVTLPLVHPSSIL